MIRAQIRLDTLSDVHKFVEVMSKVKGQVWLSDDDGSRVSAKSLLGALYSMEWTRIYCYYESNITVELMPWMV